MSWATPHQGNLNRKCGLCCLRQFSQGKLDPGEKPDKEQISESDNPLLK